ncbi:pyridoxal phosphate-dependent transferase [Desarmillaria tabescens]|uniref:Pyridoxal phosphate-dependent transferase n=1 Tax=Armillaria tabescens TaxID=1929756 RepID=A0AA39NR48_ARMTA|nr:pyridoxal phosphate-dependent transferase [Desarmillaria tabescens]KAK0470332.1 pyridoxal phosphate-dependent transferase [Desarmillaria tabescens]
MYRLGTSLSRCSTRAVNVTAAATRYNARGLSTESLQAFGEKHVTRGVGRITEGVVAQGRGSYVDFQDGRHMLDFTSGIGVTNLGHCHPKVSKAAADQCMNIVHAQCGIAFHEPYLQLIERLLPLMPHPSLDSFFFWNSGSEAIECAIKMARIATGRPNIISMQGGYHGRTFGAMAVTRSKTIYSEGVAPLMPGTFSIPFPFWHQFGASPTISESELTAKSLYQLEILLAQQSAPRDTAALIIEPVLGEGGYVPAPNEFLQGLREICDKHGIMLIIDEVQSGFCRTGTWFAVEPSGVRPDILISAKGLANGFPLSVIISRKEITDLLKPGSMGGTYAGNAVSCAAAVAVADAMKEEKILDNVKERSKQIFAELNALNADLEVAPYILDVRGRGLMVAVEFASSASAGSQYDVVASKTEQVGLAGRVAKKCIEKGMLILTTSMYEVVRFIPPLNISEEEMAKGCQIFAEAVREVIKA